MSRSTRSSTDRNGSLHSTVRCAWSLSLRCTQSTVKSRPAAWAAAMKSPRSLARVVCGGASFASLDLAVVGDPLDHALALQQVEQAAAAADVVVGQVQLGDAGAGQVQVVALAVALDEPVLDRPVDLAVDQRQVLGLDGVQRAAPQVEHAR